MSKIRLWGGLKFGELEILFSVNSAFESQTPKIKKRGIEFTPPPKSALNLKPVKSPLSMKGFQILIQSKNQTSYVSVNTFSKSIILKWADKYKEYTKRRKYQRMGTTFLIITILFYVELFTHLISMVVNYQWHLSRYHRHAQWLTKKLWKYFSFKIFFKNLCKSWSSICKKDNDLKKKKQEEDHDKKWYHKR